jgi:hypothetical protein
VEGFNAARADLIAFNIATAQRRATKFPATRHLESFEAWTALLFHEPL